MTPMEQTHALFRVISMGDLARMVAAPDFEEMELFMMMKYGIVAVPG